jgi:hypothetical protein
VFKCLHPLEWFCLLPFLSIGSESSLAETCPQGFGHEVCLLKCTDTNAGQHLHGMIEELVERQARLIQRLQSELISTSNTEVLPELVVELNDLRRQQERAQKDLRKTGPSLFERARQLDRLLSHQLRSLHQGQHHFLLKH